MAQRGTMAKLQTRNAASKLSVGSVLLLLCVQERTRASQTSLTPVDTSCHPC